MIFKVDFQKAYDCVNWKFLDSVMEQMNFSSKWRRWTHGCISSARVFVLLNGSLTGEFGMERGLRQGDPLSPFLFLLAAESMSAMLAETVDAGLFKPTLIGATSIPLTLLQYVDDAIIMREWGSSNAGNLVKFLRCFEAVFGLKVNLQKSKIIGIGVSPLEVQRIASRLHCNVDSTPFTYLGLPVGANMNRLASWSVVVDKVTKKLNTWKANTLSMADV